MFYHRKIEGIDITEGAELILSDLLNENPKLKQIFDNAKDKEQVNGEIKKWAEEELKKNPDAENFYNSDKPDREDYDKLMWKDFATIRILDYVENSGREFENPNLRGDMIINNPFANLWLEYKNSAKAVNVNFMKDMLNLFRQFRDNSKPHLPKKETVMKWMDRHHSGLDKDIIKIHEDNRDRILNLIIDKIDSGEIDDRNYKFKEGISQEEKFRTALLWWQEPKFHLRFAIRNADRLNEFLGNNLDDETMDILHEAEKLGIPIFVNPYYLSLLLVDSDDPEKNYDWAVRSYILYSRELIQEYGHIMAWEKEDIVKEGEPNAAGWLVPGNHCVHRRYPEVAILIPETMGRACAGLCSSCQRMYDFQSGHLNFNLDKLRPKETWKEKLQRLLRYWEEDSQLRDILITGGDALMSSDKSLKQVLDEVYNMAERKKQANKSRPDGEKYAELLRVRLGTRLPAYLPQRIDENLANILKDFKNKASKLGVRQFVIQTHFESPLEITPESKRAIDLLISAGWMVTNQHVFTAASSRKGHAAKLRSVLNQIGIVNYYNFTVKGFMENHNNFATNARAVQEQLEEKRFGILNEDFYERLKALPDHSEDIVANIEKIKNDADLPFLATDRNVLNLPGVGKSLTFRTVGITMLGRRILEFDHDATRNHSPIINKMGKVIIIESKAIGEYLAQLEAMGDNIEEYKDLWGYSIGNTEPRMPIYEYPDYDFDITPEYSNLQID